MALANTRVEVAIGVDGLELAQAGAIGHGGGERDDALVLLRQVDHRVGEGGRPGLAGALVDRDAAAFDLKRGGRVELGRLAGSDLVARHVRVHVPRRPEMPAQGRHDQGEQR